MFKRLIYPSAKLAYKFSKTAVICIPIKEELLGVFRNFTVMCSKVDGLSLLKNIKI